MTRLLPCNRFLVVKPYVKIRDNNEVKEVLLPEEFIKQQKKEEQFSLYEIVETNSFLYSRGDIVVVESSMVRDILIENESHYLIQDNYILAVVKNK